MHQILVSITFLFKLLLLWVVFQSTVSAEMYKWIDEDGNTHYTQSPPPGDIQPDIIKAPPKVDSDSAIKSIKAREKKADELADNRKKSAEEAVKAEEKAAKKKEHCERSKAQLVKYQRPRISTMDEEGNVIRSTEEERQAGIKRIEEQIKKACE
jgi:uncharacterized protein DUF4124